MARAKAALALGLDQFEFVLIGGTPEHHKSEIPNLRYISYPVSRYSARYFRTVFQRFSIIGSLLERANYERIILRYPGADPSAARFLKRVRTFTEHHTDELSEGRGKLEAGFPFPERQMKKLRYGLERRYGAAALRCCVGLIGVTDEIRRAELARAGTSAAALQSIVIPNGVDVRNVKHTGFTPFDGITLNAAFVASIVSPLRAPWHGLDRVTAGLHEYKGAVNVRLHIVGQMDDGGLDVPYPPGVSVLHHGRMSGAELDELLSSMNLAFSTLALHRKNMSQACSLKTREYFARGLPFVLAYDDPDVATCTDADDFFLRVPSGEDPVDFDQVVDFAIRLSTKDCREVSDSMRSYALESMDWSKKISDLWSFASSV